VLRRRSASDELAGLRLASKRGGRERRTAATVCPLYLASSHPPRGRRGVDSDPAPARRSGVPPQRTASVELEYVGVWGRTPPTPAVDASRDSPLGDGDSPAPQHPLPYGQSEKAEPGRSCKSPARVAKLPQKERTSIATKPASTLRPESAQTAARVASDPGRPWRAQRPLCSGGYDDSADGQRSHRCRRPRGCPKRSSPNSVMELEGEAQG
jgi:hypothetical protein